MSLAEVLEQLTQQIIELTEHVQPLYHYESLSQLNAQASPSDAMNLNIAIAYALHSLYYILLKLQGQNLGDHPVKKEIENVRRYVTRVQEAVQSGNSSVRIDAMRAAGPGRLLKGSTPLPQAGHINWKEEINKLIKK